MRKLVVGSVAAVAAVMALSSCAHRDAPASSDSRRQVTVAGSGQVQGTPDVLGADLGISNTAADVSAAVDATNARAKAVADALTAGGVDSKDIRTTNVTISPQNTGPDAAVTGYVATNSVHIIVRNLTQASSVLDAAIAAGGNATRLSGVAFDIDDNTKLTDDARASAFADAKKRAQQYADLAGLSLGKVITITEAPASDNSITPRAESVGTLQLSPGQQTVGLNVTVTWELT